jgi:hypothetical protein
MPNVAEASEETGLTKIATGQEIAVLELKSSAIDYVNGRPSSVLIRAEIRAAFLAELKDRVKDFEARKLTVGTKAERDEITSFAYQQLTLRKSPIEEAAKQLTKEYRDKTKAVNDDKKDILEDIDALVKRVRKDLDVWKAEEAKREAKIKEDLDFLDAARMISADDTSATLRARLATVEAINGDVDRVEAKVFTIKSLKESIDKLTRDEADRAELEAFRAERVKRAAEEDARKRQEAEQAEALIQAEGKRIAGHEAALAALCGMVRDITSPYNSLERVQYLASGFDAVAAHERDWQEFRPRYDELMAEARKDIAACLETHAIMEEFKKQELEKRIQREREEAAELAAAEERRKAEDAEQARLAFLATQDRLEAERQANVLHRTAIIDAVIAGVADAGRISKAKAANIVQAILDGRIEPLCIKF